MESDKNKRLVIKSNSLNEARYKLSSLEQKIVLSVISLIKSGDKTLDYKLTVKELIKLLNLKGKGFYRDIIRISEELTNKEVQIKTETGSKLTSSWFSSVEYFGKDYKERQKIDRDKIKKALGEAKKLEETKRILELELRKIKNNLESFEYYIEFSFDKKLKPYFLQLKERFIRYHFENIVQLKSFYSIRIYELLKQYEKIGTRTFEVEELKNILGIGENEYSRYTHFKARVILPSQRELPKKTDLGFSFDEIKQGREVQSIKFIIKQVSSEKNKYNLDDVKQIESHSELNKLINLLPEEHREKETIINLLSRSLKKHNFNYISQNIKYTNNNCDKNYRVYLTKALSGNWGLELYEDLKVKEKKELEEREKRKVEAENRKIAAELENKIDELISKNKDELEKEALKRLDKELYIKALENDSVGRFALTGMIRQVASEKVAIG